MRVDTRDAARTPPPRPLQRVVRAIAALMAVGALTLTGAAACGSRTAPDGQGTSTPTSGGTVQPGGPADDELGYYVVGGLKPHTDQVVLDRDGTATLSRRGEQVAKCTVVRGQVTQLFELSAGAEPPMIKDSPTTAPQAKTPAPDMMESGIIVNGDKVTTGTAAIAPEPWPTIAKLLGKVYEDLVAQADGTERPATHMCG